MRLSKTTSYTIHALVYMARQQDDQPLASHVAAREQGLPAVYLARGFQLLVAVGILKSVQGPNGGYRLAKAPKDITLLEIIEAVDGPIQSQGVFEEGSRSTLGKKLQAVCDQVNEEARRQLGKVRLSDLAGKA
jgi:Rrf2 family protein